VELLPKPVKVWWNKLMSQFPLLLSWWKYLLLVLGLAAIYLVTARLGLALALLPAEKATAVWLPSGIALDVLLILGYRLWPGIALGPSWLTSGTSLTPATSSPC
jgi:integral membrane sensor domain MASE1